MYKYFKLYLAKFFLSQFKINVDKKGGLFYGSSTDDILVVDSNSIDYQNHLHHSMYRPPSTTRTNRGLVNDGLRPGRNIAL